MNTWAATGDLAPCAQSTRSMLPAIQSSAPQCPLTIGFGTPLEVIDTFLEVCPRPEHVPGEVITVNLGGAHTYSAGELNGLGTGTITTDFYGPVNVAAQDVE